jgi:DNA invertase Pin-like site-specific DNA recombinase
VFVYVPGARTGIYARVSSDRDGRQLGVKRQIADCETLAQAKTWSVVRHYVDDDVSAYSGKTRPAYRELIEDMGGGRSMQ